MSRARLAYSTEPACIRHTDLPGASRLFADFSYHFDRVARFYRHDPHDPASIPAAVKEIDYPGERRASLVQALRRQNGDSDSLRLLAQPGTAAVVTGQQVGLFGGPAYTIYKALTAARLARNLSGRGIPAVPVFWLASEDHDFPEVATAWGFDGSNRPVRFQVEPPAEAKERPRPVGGIRIVKYPLDELRRSLAGFPDAEETIAAVEQSYQPGATMAEGFRALLKRIVGRLGLILLDPLDTEIRAISAPLMAEALSAAPDLKARLLERNRELAAAGYHAQVHLEPKTSLFFLLENGERVTLRLKDSEFASLRGRAAEVSPNALLRPVMQDYLLPTAVYIGGPGELAYFAQSRVIYEMLLGRMPVVLPRSSFTLLDAHAQKLLARYKLTLPEALVHEESLKERFARALVPETVEMAFENAAGEMRASLERLGQEVEGFDPTLAASLSKSRAKALYQIEKVRRKTAREIFRRDARAGEDARALHSLLFPHRHLQERFYSILPFLAKHGFGLVDRLYETVETSCFDHRVLSI
ncbi:MAG TPA: bacillithiol biosynthesis cysteine-adding enzyme BshC [Bryobacteraceae bacterium]|nr:bacillithiol biosynthesis cysteine-adding enzyme BshC [Bryobacteraceae bacterium]